MKVIFDLDDFSNDNNVLTKLKMLKGILPNLKVNLFTIPNKITKTLLLKVKECDWVRLIPHGFDHNDNYECAKMDYDTAISKLKEIDMGYYDKGFKAPGWQISKEMMQALKDLGWWVAVQWSNGRMEGNINGEYQPKVINGLNYYAINEVKDHLVIHGHCTNVCNNGIDEIWNKLIEIPKDKEFVFINEFVKGEEIK